MKEPAEVPPVLSVLVLNYNYGRYLAECLDSILSQTFSDFEVIVIDDASTDDSLTVAAGFEADPRVRNHRHGENRGFVASLVEGTNELSRGEFLMVISADDLVMETDAFSSQVAALRKNDDCVAAVTGFCKFGEGTKTENRALFHGDQVVASRRFARCLLTDREFTLLHSGTMIRAASYRSAGGYRPDLTNYLDLAMWLALSHAGPISYIDGTLFGYRVHGAQFSGSGKRRRAVLREGLMVLNAEVEAWRAEGLNVSRARVLRARIADLALADAFAGRRVRGLQRCVDAAVLAPAAALTSPGWWLAGARSLLGTRCWSLVARIRRRAA